MRATERGCGSSLVSGPFVLSSIGVVRFALGRTGSPILLIEAAVRPTVARSEGITDGYAVLTVHDSYIAHFGYHDLVQEALEEAFSRVTSMTDIKSERTGGSMGG